MIVCLALDGKDLKKTDDFLLALQPRSPGDKIKLAYQHGDKKETAEITLADRPGTGGKGKKSRGTLGVQVEETEDGVILTEISEEGSCPKSRLAGRRCVANVSMDTKSARCRCYSKRCQAKKIGETVKLGYLRGGAKKEVTLKLEGPLTPPGRPFAGPLGGQKANMQDLQGPDSRQDRRHLPLRRRRRLLDAHQQPQRAPLLFFRRPLRPQRRKDDLCSRHEPLPQHRRRQELFRRRHQHRRPFRPARSLDQSQG